MLPPRVFGRGLVGEEVWRFSPKKTQPRTLGKNNSNWEGKCKFRELLPLLFSVGFCFLGGVDHAQCRTKTGESINSMRNNLKVDWWIQVPDVNLVPQAYSTTYPVFGHWAQISRQVRRMPPGCSERVAQNDHASDAPRPLEKMKDGRGG